MQRGRVRRGSKDQYTSKSQTDHDPAPFHEYRPAQLVRVMHTAKIGVYPKLRSVKKQDPMSSIVLGLAKILPTIRRHGDFYATGTMEMFAPNLEIEGVGRISLPLLPMQAEQLVAVATRAPYGRGEETVFDTNVRRTWQIDADRVHIGGRHWMQTLDSIVEKAAAGLGVTGPVSAELYKLLVYDTGSFFVEHRDTEKAAGMFATLVIVLPSDYSGGALLVRHHDREVCLDLHCPDPSEVAFAAFYADCVHEMRPVTEGHRLTLVYNMVRTGKRQAKDKEPKPPMYEKELTEVTALLQRWVSGKNLPDDDSPEKLIYPLEHAYTSAELAFDSLKNADAAVAAVLVAAAEKAACDIHVALICIEESGSAEYSGYGSRYDEEFEVGEVIDRIETVAEWRRPDGSRPTLNALPVEDNELCPPDALDDADPDEEYFREATGNEGASFERTYRRAAIVIWPKIRKLAVINQAGLNVTLPYLAELTREWVASGRGEESTFWRDAHTLSKYMLEDWPTRRGYGGQMDSEIKMLTCLHELRDTAHIDTFLSDISGTGTYGGSENEAVVRAAVLLPHHRTTDLIEKIVVRNAHRVPGACTNLLARSCAELPEALARLYPAATALIETLLGERAARNPDPCDYWGPPIPTDANLLADLFIALCYLDANTLSNRVIEHALSSHKSFPMDKVLVPATLVLTERMQTRDWAPVLRLRAACVRHLQTRCAEPLAPPADFARASTIACQCASCAELRRFLAAPDRSVWEFKAAEPQRRHVENSIRQNRCDLDFVTEKRSRPYSLVCTKNQASYKRRAAQRKKDIEVLGRLGVAI
jgi:predicted 2-oxoglutarate/Fe(II)-dependent dioxygenase YbiX